MNVEYADSGLTVAAAIVFREIRGFEHVLLAERLEGSFRGELHPPGGFVEVGESPEDAAARELLEEAVIAVSTKDFITSPRNRDFMYIYDGRKKERHVFRPFNVVRWEARMGYPQRSRELLGRWEWVRLLRYGVNLLEDKRVPSNVQTVIWAAKRIAEGKHQLP